MNMKLSTTLRNVTGALLVALTTLVHGIELTGAGNVNQERALNANGEPGNWLLLGRDFASQHYSPLGQIHDRNIKGLMPAWYADVFSPDGLVATPVVVDGVVYISGSFARVYAYDAGNGEMLWQFDPRVKRDDSLMSSWGVRVNRGVSVWNGKVYIGTGDCRLIAIDAAKGTKVWETPACDPGQNYSITGAPRVANDLVFIGSGGSDYGARGFVAAFDSETGKEVWRFWTVPGDPAKGHENDAMAMAAGTWTGDAPWKNGGGAVWEAMTYDPDFNQLIIGVAGGVPWDPNVRSPDGGDTLFLCSIVALDADTGEYRWHYQTVPRDAWDYDATMHIMLAELDVAGERRKVLMQAPKNGFFYVLERETGKLISANNFVKVTWADNIDMESGRPVQLPGARYYEQESGESLVYPNIYGGHSWQPMSYSPGTGLVYIPALDFPTRFIIDPQAMMGGVMIDLYGYDPHDPARPQDIGKLIAWDPVTQTQRWAVDYPYPFNGGVLSTAGGLVFQGTTTGELRAYDADVGGEKWSVKLGSAIQAAPVTYLYEGEQHVLVAAGWGGAPRTQIPEYAAAFDARGPSRLFAFKLNGEGQLPLLKDTIVLPEPPVPATASSEILEKGKRLFEVMSCSLCHGQNAMGNRGGSIPDLRYMNSAAYEKWFDTVLKGERSMLGMIAFEQYMDEEDAEAIRAYVISQAWNLREALERRMATEIRAE